MVYDSSAKVYDLPAILFALKSYVANEDTRHGITDLKDVEEITTYP
jgi:hypothetical protein